MQERSQLSNVWSSVLKKVFKSLLNNSLKLSGSLNILKYSSRSLLDFPSLWVFWTLFILLLGETNSFYLLNFPSWKKQEQLWLVVWRSLIPRKKATPRRKSYYTMLRLITGQTSELIVTMVQKVSTKSHMIWSCFCLRIFFKQRYIEKFK